MTTTTPSHSKFKRPPVAKGGKAKPGGGAPKPGGAKKGGPPDRRPAPTAVGTKR